MTPQETQEYLKIAADLEMSVYKQTEIKKEATRGLVERKVFRKKIVKPTHYNNRVEKPKSSQIDLESWKRGLFIPKILFGALPNLKSRSCWDCVYMFFCHNGSRKRC